jgi:ferritin-like metal-binding protein YciE
MKLTGLEDLYVAELQDMHSAEKQRTRALVRAASAPALASHLQDTQSQLERLVTILGEPGKKPNKNRCEAMEGPVAEGGLNRQALQAAHGTPDRP